MKILSWKLLYCYLLRSIADIIIRAPQDAAAVEIPSDQEYCVVLVEWDPPNNINSLNIDHYIIQTSTKSEIHIITETSTLATFLSLCKELRNLYFNITAIDRCKRISVSTKFSGDRPFNDKYSTVNNNYQCSSSK